VVARGNADEKARKSKVEFLHASVPQFLRDNYQTQLRAQAGEGFDPVLALCKLRPALLKFATPWVKKFELDGVLGRAVFLDLRNVPIHERMAELDHMLFDGIVAFARSGGLRFRLMNGFMWFPGLTQLFLHIAIDCGLRNYVISQIDAGPTFTKVDATPLLLCALLVHLNEFGSDLVDILKALLERRESESAPGATSADTKVPKRPK